MKSVLENSVKAQGHSPIYKMHKYFARRPHNVFSNLIEHYTDENDVILDVFCGGGVSIFEGLALNRKCIGVDLNPLATFITEMEVMNVDLELLEESWNDFFSIIKNKYDHFYQYEIENKIIKVDWIEWAYEVICPECSSKTILIEENKVRNGVYFCSNKECHVNKNGLQRTKYLPYSSKPIRLKYTTFNEETRKNEGIVHVFNNLEAEKEKKKEYYSYLSDNLKTPDELIIKEWDRYHEDCLGKKGIKKFSDFFTDRNYVLNILIYNEILNLKKKYPQTIIDILYFIFSASLRYTNNMTRVSKNWQSGNPISMDKHAYWLPNIYIENNIFLFMQNRYKAVLKGYKYKNQLFNNKKKVNNFDKLLKDGDYLIKNQSSDELSIPDSSVDLVLTDPPYGSNVQYSELSSFWNVWLKDYKELLFFIDNKKEAITNRKEKFEWSKKIQHYELMLYKIFKECYRVLKDNGYLVFTFHNKDLRVWIALLNAVAKAGFHLPLNGVIFQDYIEQYKNTSHLRFKGNVQGDFIYSLKKTEDKNNRPVIDTSISLIETLEKEVVQICNSNKFESTTEAYTAIFSHIIETILGYLKVSSIEMDEVVKISSKFLDNLIEKHSTLIK